MHYIPLIFWIGIAYLFGSIPFGLILTKFFLHQDIRQTGSKNIGATNVYRKNKWIGGLTFLLDAMKGIIPVAIGSIAISPLAMYTLALVAIIGHIFPIWLKFKGGKGVATFFGVLLYLNPLVFCISITIWILVFFSFKISSIASLSMLLITTFIALLIGPMAFFIFMILASCMIFYKHKTNIIKLIKGQERQF